MASLSKRGKSWVVRLNTAGRPKITLGAMHRNAAITTKSRIEDLEVTSATGTSPRPETAAWLAGISEDLHSRLVRNGLAPERTEKPSETVGSMAARVEAEHAQWSDNTRTSYQKAIERLKLRLGGDTPLEAVTVGDAKAYAAWLTTPKDKGGAGLAPATCSLFCSKAFQVFETAVDYELLARNPFRKTDRTAHRGAKFFLKPELALRILKALPTAELRLTFGLARWGGLRVPSEPLLLKWGDIDFEHKRFSVTCKKTSRHKGRETRVVPIFPELAPLFDAVWDEAPDGDYVLPAMRANQCRSFNSYLKWKVRKMGIDPWPRLVHNLRATRQTELRDVYPDHVVTAWLGNSSETAEKHYYQVHDAHFESAVSMGPDLGPESDGNHAQPHATVTG